MISDGGGGAVRSVIPTEPHLRIADADDAAGGMAAYPAHNGLAGPSQVGSVRVGDDWKYTKSSQASDGPTAAQARLAELNTRLSPDSVADAEDAEGARWANDDPDNFLAASDARAAGESSAPARAISDDPDGSLAANANADVTGGTAGETAFIDDSEGYLTSVGYDSNVSAARAVTDAHDRGDISTSAVTDSHDRGDVTRIADDDDAAGTTAASPDGPNIDE